MHLMLAADGVAMTQSDFLTSITGALADFSIANLSGVLVAGLGIAGGLVLAWFGYRFVTRKASGALKKGKL